MLIGTVSILLSIAKGRIGPFFSIGGRVSTGSKMDTLMVSPSSPYNVYILASVMLWGRF